MQTAAPIARMFSVSIVRGALFMFVRLMLVCAGAIALLIQPLHAQSFDKDDLRAFLDEDARFANVERFIVHSMSDPLAPLSFFEIAPVAMDIFESRSIITGAKLESSLYWTVAGGVSQQKNSRRLFEENRVVLHSGGLTGFDRGSPRDSIATLLEVSSAMMVEGHC